MTTAPCLPPVQVQVRHPVHKQKEPPLIAYFGGRQPHVTVNWDSGDSGDASVYRLHTPRGWVTIRWREDNGTEDGGPWPMDDEISHPDTIIDIVIVSPSALPIYFRGVGNGVKWLHVNGNRLPLMKPDYGPYDHPISPIRMDGGLNIIAVAYPDPE